MKSHERDDLLISLGFMIEDMQGQPSRIRAGACDWDPTERILIVRGETVKLSWKAMECWRILVEARGAIVPREALQRRLWGDALMDESNLAHVLAGLRRQIDPAPDGKSHIETVPRMGYRLAVPISAGEPPNAGKPDAAPAEAAPAVPAHTSPHSPARRRRWALESAVVITILTTGIVLGDRLAQQLRETAEAERLARSAMKLARQGSIPGWKAAREQIDQALALEPDLPIAKAASAELSVRSGNRNFDSALAMAREAVASDPECGDCRAVLGYTLLTRYWRWSEAGEHLHLAVKDRGAQAMSHVWYAQLLGITNRFDEAHRQIEQALAKERTLINAHIMRGLLLYLQGKTAEATQRLSEAETLDFQNPTPHFWLYRCLLLEDKPLDAAIRGTRHATAHGGLSQERQDAERDAVHRAFQVGGKKGLIERWLRESEEAEAKRQHSYERAVWRVWDGQTETALDELENAEKERPFNLIYVAVDPALKPLRKTPRFRALVTRLGLPVID